jgi:hypothetical protein
VHHPAGLHKGYHVGRWGQGWHHRLAVRRDVAPASPRDRATYCRRDGATICDCKRHSRLHQPERWLPPRFLKKDLPSRDGDGRIRRASNLLLHNGGRLDKHYAIGYGLWGDAHLWTFPGFLSGNHFGVSHLRVFLIRSVCCPVERFICHLLVSLSAHRRLVLTFSP